MSSGHYLAIPRLDLSSSSLPDEELQQGRFGEDAAASRMVSQVESIADGLALLDLCDQHHMAVDDRRRALMAQMTDLRQHQSDLTQPRDGDHQFKRFPNSNWQLIAARDLAMSVEDFYRLLTSASSLLKACKVLRTRVDLDGMERARRHFEDLYPDHLDLRNAAGHPVDYSSKPHNLRRHSKKDPVTVDSIPIVAGGGAAMVSAALVNRTITYTADGDTFTLELAPVLVETLRR